MFGISIIIPAYNEERRIGRTLERYSLFFEELRRRNILDYEILVVINGTTDGTEEVVKGFSLSNVRVRYLNLAQSGKGNAVIQGFRIALGSEKNHLIGFTDADMATTPEEFWKVICESVKYDGAIADRYQKDSKIRPKPSLKRLLAKRAFNYLARALLLMPYGDTQCGAKVFKKEALENVIQKLAMSEWAFDVELLYQMNKNGYRIKSVPISWCDEEYSTINFWKAGPGMALGIVRLRIINSPMKFLMDAYDKLRRNL
tara:strand:- start:515 stop:1288 length:774 start_codon:yes stop_codon:yes gene_type:complete